MTIFHSYEDTYLDKERRKIFEELFEKYLAKVDTEGTMEIYDAVIKLERQSRIDFDSIVKTLKEQSLLPE
jgi:hypothetical protein